MYEGDTPNAERRAAALSLDRDLLRELLGQEELRDLIDPSALDAVEADLQHLSERTQAATRDALADVLRRIGDLTTDELRQRVIGGCDGAAMLAELERERRALLVRVGGEERWIAADDAGLYRDALGVVPPGGLPEAFVAPVDGALTKLVARYARTHGPFTTEELRGRYGTGAASLELALGELERAGDIVEGELRPTERMSASGGREWCDTEVLRRLRRASLAVLRKEIEASEQQALATLLPSWQGVDRHSRSIGSDAAGVERLREVLVPLQGLALPVEVWERDVLPRRTGAYLPTWLDQLCASGEVVWAGAGPHHNSGRVALYFRDDAVALGPPSSKGRSEADANASVDTPAHLLVRERLAQSPCFFSDLLAELPLAPEQVQQALWDLVWAGEATNDAWAPLRAPRLSLARSGPPSRGTIARSRRRSGTRFGTRSPAGAQIQGRWSLTASIFSGAAAADPADRRRAQAELLLERYGIVTREHVLAEGVPGGFAMLYDSFAALETLGICRRGYFIEGLGGAQFALPGAVERLRAQRLSAEAPPLVLAATDPAQPYGAALPWPKLDDDAGERAARRPRRVVDAHVVLVGAEPAIYVERGGKGLLMLVPIEDPRMRPGLEALAAFVLADRRRKLALERIDGEPVVGSPWEPLLVELGFRTSPRRLLLSA
jgi:ATP-dependent Lhr-like helicase